MDHVVSFAGVFNREKESSCKGNPRKWEHDWVGCVERVLADHPDPEGHRNQVSRIQQGHCVFLNTTEATRFALPLVCGSTAGSSRSGAERVLSVLA